VAVPRAKRALENSVDRGTGSGRREPQKGLAIADLEVWVVCGKFFVTAIFAGRNGRRGIIFFGQSDFEARSDPKYCL
jgi:hypothetical protein